MWQMYPFHGVLLGLYWDPIPSSGESSRTTICTPRCSTSPAYVPRSLEPGDRIASCPQRLMAWHKQMRSAAALASLQAAACSADLCKAVCSQHRGAQSIHSLIIYLSCASSRPKQAKTLGRRIYVGSHATHKP